MITKEQWSQVEASLSSPYGSANLLVDDFKVTLSIVCAGGLKFEIIVYVNGWSKGEWLTKDCEERRRFLRPVQHSLWSTKDIAAITKGLSKAAVKKYSPNLDKKFTSYSLCWPSFAPLKRHLIKNNTTIALAPVDAEESA